MIRALVTLLLRAKRGNVDQEPSLPLMEIAALRSQ
jgi:hypothetical protein